jgi:hypothetical protein
MTPASPGATATTLGLQDELSRERGLLERLIADSATITVYAGGDSLWFQALFPGGGGFALRAGYLAGNQMLSVERDGGSYILHYAAGTVRVEFEYAGGLFQFRTFLRPNEDLALPFYPRDFYPIDASGDPHGTKIRVHAVQSKLAGGIAHITLDRPKVGSFLYFQNFTALNPYFAKTATKPEDAVGGKWPELGYQPPTSPDHPLEGGKEILVSDAWVGFDPEIPTNSDQAGRQLMELLAQVYLKLEKPPADRQDWLSLPERTVRSLSSAPSASVTYWGEKFLLPYNEAEYPDSMVQANVAHGLVDYGLWRDKAVPLAAKLKRGLSRFHDREYRAIRRYLPNVGKDKNRNEVDGWYMFHPLMSLARMAKDGDEKSRELFFDSLELPMRFAKKFKHLWPVTFDLESGKATKAERRPGLPGQSDVAGLYAYVMMQANELTGDRKYIDDAIAAIRAVRHLGFELFYQANITAFGVAACARIYSETGEQEFLNRACHFAGAFFSKTVFWESEIELAKHYRTFMGVLCLDDAPYMAVLECHEAMEAFSEALTLANDDLPMAMRLLMAEYCRFALYRTWFYMPANLPEEVLSAKQRNGKIDKKLPFPLEDMYVDGQPAGQVGQEVYGAGATFAIVTHSHLIVESGPMIVYCDYPMQDLIEADRETTFKVVGSPDAACELCVLPWGRKKLPKFECFANYESLGTGPDFRIPGNSRVSIRW